MHSFDASRQATPGGGFRTKRDKDDSLMQARFGYSDVPIFRSPQNRLVLPLLSPCCSYPRLGVIQVIAWASQDVTSRGGRSQVDFLFMWTLLNRIRHCTRLFPVAPQAKERIKSTTLSNCPDQLMLQLNRFSGDNR